jgi:5-(carboxyamino)imidazole ribonucleotide synthase
MNIHGTKIGILGGGQLGKMLIEAALPWDLELHMLDPDAQAPCHKIAASFTVGSLKDFDTVYNFGKGKDLITIEIENVNTVALEKLQAEGVKVYPQPEIIRLIQDKRLQKKFYKENNIPTADFILIEEAEDIRKHLEFLPAFQKLGREGYDGRGVARIQTENDIGKALAGPGLLEKQVNYTKELSVIVTRNQSGSIAAYPVVEMAFHPEKNLVEYLFSPADISRGEEEKAKRLAEKIIETLGMTGILAVEMFLTEDGEILVNEIAPRVHNSGHQTIEGNVTSQFQQHLRAILNLKPGDTSVLIPSAMINILGEEGFDGPVKYQGFAEVLAIEGASIHLYGKKVTKPYRKMGHVTVVDSNKERLKEKAKRIKELIKVIS